MAEQPAEPAPRQEPGGTGQTVLSASAIMAAGTLISRLTGFVRAGLLAAAIGLSLNAEAFNVANTIPNSLYILIAGGVFNTVLVPQLVRAIKNDSDGGDAYANRIIGLGIVVLGIATTLLVIFAPQLLRVMVGADWFTPELTAERESLIAFARLCLPQIFFYGIFVVLGQILNARGRFGPMMWAPIANNVISIGVIVLYIVLYADQPATGGYTTQQELLLGLGSTFGIVVQMAILIPYLSRSGFLVRPRFDLRGTGLGHTIKLGLWTIGFVIVNQIAFYVIVRLATGGIAKAPDTSDPGGYTVYSNAFLFTQVPHSIVTVSLATATMPLISRLAADGKLADIADEMSQTLRLALSFIVPFAISLLVLGQAFATVMFSWGKAAGDTSSLGLTIAAFAPGLLLFSVHYIVLRGFYSMEDTRTPFFIQCLIATVSIVCAITFTHLAEPEHTSVVLALAYGTSYLVGATISATLLSSRLGGLGARRLLSFAVRVTAAAVPAAAAAWLCLRGLEQAGLDVASKLDSLVMLLVGGLVGLVVYLVMARLLRISEIARVVGLITSRGRRR